MMAAAFCLLVGFTFTEQEIPGFHVEGISVTGKPQLNGRQADLSGDGAVDLILPHQVLLQKDGIFDIKTPVSLPEAGVACDTWKSSLFLRLPDRLQVLTLEDGQWKAQLDQPVSWPHSLSKSSGGLRFERFLFDMDCDGTPELAIPDEKALHIFVKKGDAYQNVAALDVFPDLRLARNIPQSLWPHEDRRIIVPPRGMTCCYLLEGDRLAVMSPEEIASDAVQYRTYSYVLVQEPDGQLSAKVTNDTVSEPVPLDFEPCRLNEDDILDFVGDECELSEATALPVPVLETRASTDAGQQVQTVRTTSFRPQCSWVDFDGDGRVDMVTESTGLFDGGVRESINRFFVATDFFHEVHVHLQDSQGRFAAEPTITGRFKLLLDAPPHQNSEMRRNYQYGRLVNVTGDFNADRHRDVAIQDAPDRVAVYLTTDGKVSTTPAFCVPINPGERFAVADVNQDGRSDIVMYWYESAKGTRTLRNRVCFVQEGTP